LPGLLVSATEVSPRRQSQPFSPPPDAAAQKRKAEQNKAEAKQKRRKRLETACAQATTALLELEVQEGESFALTLRACVCAQVGWAPSVGWLAGSTAAEGARSGYGDVSVMDYESVALATTSVHDLSPLSPHSWISHFHAEMIVSRRVHGRGGAACESPPVTGFVGLAQANLVMPWSTFNPVKSN
jgi:hypothetical protein